MLDRIPLGYYAFAGLLNFLTSFALLIFVFFKNPKSRINQAFCLFALSVAGWGLSYFLWLTTDKSYLAEGYLRTLMVFVIFIPTTFMHFVLNLLKLDRRKFNIFNYLFSTILAVTAYTNYFAYNPEAYLVFPYWLRAGFLFYVHTVHFFGCAIYAHYLMLRALKARQGLYRNQVLYVLIGTGIGFSGGALNYLTWSRIPVPPFLNPLVSIYVATVAYAIVRHRLMDIEVIIKKTLVFAGIVAAAVSVIALPFTLVQAAIGRALGVPNPFILMALGVVTTVLIYRHVERFLVDVTDKYLFQKKEDVIVILNRLAENIITILDLEKVGQTILSTLRESLRLQSGAIAMMDESNKGYYVLDSFNTRVGKETTYEPESLFIKYLFDNQVIINLEDPAFKNKLPTRVFARLEELNATICIPLFLHKDLIGVLTLGRKKSDEEFTGREIECFPTVASQVAIALSNARLYDIQRKSQIDFIQQAKMAAIGTLSAGINHEVKNPLNIIRSGVEMLKMNDEFGLYKDYSIEDYKREVHQVLNAIMEEVDKASGIITTLSMFAHKGADLRAEEVDLEKQVDNAYAVLKSEFKYNSIEFEKEFPRDLPRVIGDSARISEVFLNIINNARQAIRKNGKIRVVAKRNITAINIDIIDNGPGMTEEIQQNIFDPFFTTKQQGEGTGLGLHICREILKRMDAEISVKSKVGEGTTFTLEFPPSKTGGYSR